MVWYLIFFLAFQFITTIDPHRRTQHFNSKRRFKFNKQFFFKFYKFITLFKMNFLNNKKHNEMCKWYSCAKLAYSARVNILYWQSHHQFSYIGKSCKFWHLISNGFLVPLPVTLFRHYLIAWLETGIFTFGVRDWKHLSFLYSVSIRISFY